MATVLVIDDEASVRRALRRLLERERLSVVEAGSGAEGLASLAGEPTIDAVIIDVLMPDMNGVEVYDRLAADHPGLRSRVVFLSAAAAEPDVHSRIEQRGAPLLSKVDDLQLVVDAIRVALVRRS